MKECDIQIWNQLPSMLSTSDIHVLYYATSEKFTQALKKAAYQGKLKQHFPSFARQFRGDRSDTTLPDIVEQRYYLHKNERSSFPETCHAPKDQNLPAWAASHIAKMKVESYRRLWFMRLRQNEASACVNSLLDINDAAIRKSRPLCTWKGSYLLYKLSLCPSYIPICFVQK